MKRIAEEAEVIVRLDYAGEKAHITVSAWPAMARKMEKLYGESKDGRNTSRSARWIVDLKAISFRRLDKSSRTPRQIPHFATATRTSGQSSHLAPETRQ